MSIKTAMINAVMRKFIYKMAAPITPSWLSSVAKLTGKAKADAIRRTMQAQQLAGAKIPVPQESLRKLVGKGPKPTPPPTPPTPTPAPALSGSPRGDQVARMGKQQRLSKKTPEGMDPRTFSMLSGDF